jgi:hypothetical protein
MDDMIFGLFVDRNVALLNSATKSLDNVAFCIDEDSRVIPAREYFVGTPVSDRFAKAYKATSPTIAVSENEIAGARINDLFACRKSLDRSSVKRGPRAFCKHDASKLQIAVASKSHTEETPVFKLGTTRPCLH